MPYGDPDAQDPMQLVGMGVPCDVGTHREMASVFAEEFARLGYDLQEILHLFRNPFYAAAHRGYQVLGEAEILRLVEEVIEVWSRVRFTDQTPLAQRRPHEGELLWPRSTTGS